jgi:hypothetical protein
MSKGLEIAREWWGEKDDYPHPGDWDDLVEIIDNHWKEHASRLQAKSKALLDLIEHWCGEKHAAGDYFGRCPACVCDDLAAAQSRLNSALALVREVLEGSAEPADWNPRARIVLGAVENACIVITGQIDPENPPGTPPGWTEVRGNTIENAPHRPLCWHGVSLYESCAQCGRAVETGPLKSESL